MAEYLNISHRRARPIPLGRPDPSSGNYSKFAKQQHSAQEPADSVFWLAFWSVGDAEAAAENLALAGVAWAPLQNDFKIRLAILEKQFGLFLSAGNASERWWRLWCVEVWPALYF